MRLSIGETARRAGVSVRALRYYDQIGLLAPSEVTDAGYRYYDVDALTRLQQILFYKELDIPLEQIRHILDASDAERAEDLRKHRRLLEMKRERIDDMIRLVDETIGGKEMFEERATPTAMDYARAREKYAQEAAERWGETDAFRQSQERYAGYANADWARVQGDMEDIFSTFGACSDPEGDEGKRLAKRWQEHLSNNHYDCTDTILAGLAEMYENDPRFAENLDAFGPGTARKMSLAIRAFLREKS